MSHSFHSAAKQSYREDCISFVRGAKGLVKPDGFLVGSWCELAGETSMVTLDSLVEGQLIKDDQFIGVDRDMRIISLCRKARPESTWKHGSLLELAHDIGTVSVLNFDSYRECGSRDLVLDVDGLRPIISRSVSHHGSCCLFVNSDLDALKRKRRSPQAGLKDHIRLLCLTLDGWLPGRSLDPHQILPDDSSVDSKFTGRVGDHIYIYRSRSHRMVNVKLLLR